MDEEKVQLREIYKIIRKQKWRNEMVKKYEKKKDSKVVWTNYHVCCARKVRGGSRQVL